MSFISGGTKIRQAVSLCLIKRVEESQGTNAASLETIKTKARCVNGAQWRFSVDSKIRPFGEDVHMRILEVPLR